MSTSVAAPAAVRMPPHRSGCTPGEPSGRRKGARRFDTTAPGFLSRTATAPIVNSFFGPDNTTSVAIQRNLTVARVVATGGTSTIMRGRTGVRTDWSCAGRRRAVGPGPGFPCRGPRLAVRGGVRAGHRRRTGATGLRRHHLPGRYGCPRSVHRLVGPAGADSAADGVSVRKLLSAAQPVTPSNVSLCKSWRPRTGASAS